MKCKIHENPALLYGLSVKNLLNFNENRIPIRVLAKDIKCIVYGNNIHNDHMNIN
jgi:hypothetical protein